MKEKIEGEYKFSIRRDDGVYLATCVCPDGYEAITCGKTEEEVFEMIADLYLSIYDIKISAWKRFIIKLFRL